MFVHLEKLCFDFAQHSAISWVERSRNPPLEQGILLLG
jgi:hypothetical protein